MSKGARRIVCDGRAHVALCVRAQDPNSTYHHIHRLLSKHREHIRSDPWAGLPELTNENGARCNDSCETQAWSTSTILDALDDIRIKQGN